MITDEMQNILLDISPESDYLSEFFGDPGEDIKNEVDRAMEIILESAELDHEGWHKKHPNEDHCPGHMTFIGKAMKGFLLSHAEKYSDAMVMAIISLVMLNVGNKSAETAAKEKELKNLPVPDFSGFENLAGLPIGADVIDNITDPAVKQRVLTFIANVAANGGQASDEHFNALMGITDEMSSRDKLVQVMDTMEKIPLPKDMPPELKAKADELFEALRKRLNK